jgi:RHS repeat-associated protein
MVQRDRHYDNGGFPDTIRYKYTYNSFGEVLTYTDPLGAVTTNTYDTHGNLRSTTDALNHTTTIDYLSNGVMSSITDARGNTTQVEFNQGLLEKTLDAGDNKTMFYYDTRGRLSSTMNMKSETTSFEFDTRNRLKRVTYPDSNFVSRNYDLAGRLTSTTNERGYTATYGYDGAYRLKTITDALNHTTTFNYDIMSNMDWQTDALGNKTDYHYDSFNRLDRITYPLPETGETRLYEEVEYNEVGNVKSKKDTAGRTTSYEYDDLHRVKNVTDALSHVTRFEYNLRSQTTKVKDALNQEYTFTYDPLGRMLSQTRAGTTKSFKYNEVGSLKKRTDYNGQVTNYTYNSRNSLTNIAYTGSTNYATYGYDELSRLTSAENQNGTVTMDYNNRGWMNTTTDVHGRKVDYAYDEAGNREVLEVDDTVNTSYAYDEANRLTTLSDASNSDYVFDYDDANRLITKTLPNTVATSYTYDGMGRLTGLKHESTKGVMFDNAYHYNTANQIDQITDLAQTRDFSYDDLNRLTDVSVSSAQTEGYAYDYTGNRTSSQGITSYTNGAFNRTTAAGTRSYTYDDNGNRTTRATPLGGGVTLTGTYTWDEENRLVGHNITNGINSSNTVSAAYEYDALGRRVEKSVATGGSVQRTETDFTYDGSDVVLDVETAPLSLSIENYCQNGPGIDNKISIGSGVDAKRFLQDHLGSTLGLVDIEGAVLDTNEYDSFGNATNSSFPTRYQFTGREFESETGLQYTRARWYDPQIGKFISEDPIGFAGGDINLYGYVGNDPLNSTDPSGLFPSASWLGDKYAVHQAIGSRALNGIATPEQIERINAANERFDADTQSSKFGPVHAMTRPGQTPEDARKEANAFVRGKICAARELWDQGKPDLAMNELAKAIHTVQDAASPKHAGFQPAWEDTYWQMFQHRDHYLGENFDPGAGSVADRNTQDVWNAFNNRGPLPADFFNNGFDPQPGVDSSGEYHFREQTPGQVPIM